MSTMRSFSDLAEAAEDHRVDRADPVAGLHGDDGLDRHGQVDHHPVAALDAAGLHGVGQLADARQQGAVADRCHRAVVGFEDNGGALAQPAGDVPVQAIEGRIEPAVAEPAVKGRMGIVQHLGERLAPSQRLARQARPESRVVPFGLVDQRPVGVHAGDVGGGRDTGCWRDQFLRGSGGRGRGCIGTAVAGGGVLHVRSPGVCVRASGRPASLREGQPAASSCPAASSSRSQCSVENGRGGRIFSTLPAAAQVLTRMRRWRRPFTRRSASRVSGAPA